jgi:hypothetical protein
MQTIQLPELNVGEKYAGFTLDEEGQPKEHIILLPGDVGDVTWEQAIEFANEAGGDLPSRQEQALLYANLKGELKAYWHWSSTQYSRYDASSQDFSCCGSQVSLDKHYKLRARAVRRLPI